MARVRSPSWFRPPVLVAEFAEAQEVIQQALERRIKSRGVVVRMCVADIGSICVEIVHFRRCREGIINARVRAELRKHLAQLLKAEEAETLAAAWFTDKKAKEKILALLSQLQLNESAIEAEARRRCIPDLELFDRMLATVEWRRNQAIRCVADYDGPFWASVLQKRSDLIIAAMDVRRVERTSGNKSAEA